LQGCMEKPFGWLMRAIVGAAGLAAIWPGVILINVLGAAAVIGLLIFNIKFTKRTDNAAVAA